MEINSRRENFYTQDLLRRDYVHVGAYTYGQPQIYSWGEGANLYIGKFCSIAEGVRVFLGGNHRTDWVTTYPFPALKDEWPEASNIEGHPSTKGDVVIGNDVWIGDGATILSGITIGDGSVIGANCLVAQNIEPYSIVVGNPGRCVKKRFSDKRVRKLLSIKWWNWSEKEIRANIQALCSGNIETLIKTYEKNRHLHS